MKNDVVELTMQFCLWQTETMRLKRACQYSVLHSRNIKAHIGKKLSLGLKIWRKNRLSQLKICMHRTRTQTLLYVYDVCWVLRTGALTSYNQVFINSYDVLPNSLDVQNSHFNILNATKFHHVFWCNPHECSIISF